MVAFLGIEMLKNPDILHSSGPDIDCCYGENLSLIDTIYVSVWNKGEEEMGINT